MELSVILIPNQWYLKSASGLSPSLKDNLGRSGEILFTRGIRTVIKGFTISTL